jgi:hypothetical protein
VFALEKNQNLKTAKTPKWPLSKMEIFKKTAKTPKLLSLSEK